MNGLIEAAGSLLDPRRVTAAWLPVAAFLLGLLTILVGALGVTDALAAWTTLGAAGQVIAVALFLVVSVLLAGILDSRRITFTRLLEGYVPTRLGPLAARLRERHVAHRAALTRAEQRGRYPRGEVRPTRIGNTIAAAEEHGARYGIDTVAAWPRLYPTLPEPFLAAFGAAAGSLHAMTTLCVLGGTFAVVGGVLAMLLLPWWGTLICLLTGATVAIAAYRGAAQAAIPYAELIRSAYDVHRWALLDAAGLRRPTSFGGEVAQWTQLRRLWELGLLDSDGSVAMRYPLPAGVSAEPPTPAPPSDLPRLEPSPTGRPPAQPTPGPTGTPARPPRPRLWLALFAVAVGALLVGATVGRGELVTVIPNHGNELRATTDLPAYRPLTCADVSEGGGPDEPSDVVGRYPLESLRRGDPVQKDRLGPVVGPLDGRFVTTLGTTTTTAPRAIPRGTTISVALVPPASPPAPAPAVIVTDLLVLEVLATAPAQVVVAAPADRLAMLQRPGSLSVLLDPSAVVLSTTPVAPGACGP